MLMERRRRQPFRAESADSFATIEKNVRGGWLIERFFKNLFEPVAVRDRLGEYKYNRLNDCKA